MKNLQTYKLATSFSGGHLRQNVPGGPVEETPQLPAASPAPEPTARRTATGGKTLLALLALDAIATLAAVEATGAVHNGYIRLASFGLAILVAAGALAAVAVVYTGRRRPVSATRAVAAAAPADRKRFSPVKAILMLMMLVGIVAYFGGAGTFAGFTAQTTNPNSTLGSGSVLLQNTVNANAVCESKTGESNNNVNANCTPLFSFTNQEPGVFSGVSTVTIKNSGTLPASTMYLWAPYANGVLGSTITSGTSVTSLSLYASGHGPAGLEGTVNSGDHILVTYGGSSQTFVASAGAAPGATTINVTSLAATATFQAGATVEDLDSNTSAANTNCYDTQLVNLGFNSTTNNPLCSASVLFVQETTGGFNYCWWGSGAGSANGQCDAPISSNPTGLGTSANQTIATGTYAVSALKGNIKSGDTVAFTEGANQITCPSSADYYYGATSITVGACTLRAGSVNGVFDNNAVVTDTSVLTRIASDTTHNISKFDQTAGYANKIELTPVTANGTKTPNGTDLASNATRTFVVGVVIAGSNAAAPANAQNQLQQLKSTFGLVWHIDQ